MIKSTGRNFLKGKSGKIYRKSEENLNISCTTSFVADAITSFGKFSRWTFEIHDELPGKNHSNNKFPSSINNKLKQLTVNWGV
jgi:hypothetical protein